MAQPAEKPPAETQLYDRAAVEREYWRNRARREARAQRKRARRAAGIRFWLVIVALIGLSVYLGLVIWHEIQKLFGL